MWGARRVSFSLLGLQTAIVLSAASAPLTKKKNNPLATFLLLIIAGSEQKPMSLQKCAQHALNSNKQAMAYNKNERSCYLALDEQAGKKASSWSVYRVKGGLKTPTVVVCDDTRECSPSNKWDIKIGRHNIGLTFGTFINV